MQRQNNAIIGIYKIISPSRKVYIGQSMDINKRWNIHKNLYDLKDYTKLKRSLKKHGVENHMFEIIEECSLDQLNEREIYWGLHNDVLGENGLNLKLGNANGKMNEETKIKIGKNKKGHICYENINRGEKISKKLKGRIKTWGKGKEKQGKKQQPPFKEHLKRIHSKAIIQYDKQNNIIMKYTSILEASLHTKINRENIGCVLRNITKTAGGFIWKYKEDLLN